MTESEHVTGAPSVPKVGCIDEVRAARKPILRWLPPEAEPR